MIIVGLRTETCTVGRDETKLTIDAEVCPTIFSPVDIMSCMTFTEDAIEVARRCLPDSPLISELAPP
jgi:hypothetical protein